MTDPVAEAVGHATMSVVGTGAAPESAHRSDIDGLRGIAVLSVFAVHSIPHALRGGFVGVDVFFVISGYLIATITLAEQARQSFSPIDFYARRIRRLAPALVLVLSACLAFAALRAFPKDAREIGKHVIGGAAFLSNWLLWQEAGYFDQSSRFKPLLHLWSLGVEEQFYLLWPLAAWVLWRLRDRAIFLVSAALVGSFLLNVAFVTMKPKGTFFLPPTRFWEILAGVLLAYLTSSTIRNRRAPRYSVAGSRRLANSVAGLGVCLFVLSLCLINQTEDFPGWWALLPTSATVALIAAGPAAWTNRVLLSHPILTFYGRISYPLYLWHWPLLTLPALMDEPLDTVGFVGLLCVAVVLATLTYDWVEIPLRFGAQARRAPLTLLLGLAATAALGTCLLETDGLLQRYPADVRPIADVQVHTDYRQYRVERCFLRSEQGPSAFADECAGKLLHDRPLAFLWGDSHAAALYPGLSLQLETSLAGHGLAQYTAAACAPGWRSARKDSPGCADLNEFVWKRIDALHPDTVVLAAHWTDYADGPHANSDSSMGLPAFLQQFIRDLHTRGVNNVVVFGPLPKWQVAPPRILLKEWAAGRPLPKRSVLALSRAAIELDKSLELAVTAADARYVSAIAALCNSEGCEVSVEKNAQFHPIAFDESHLTVEGSEELVRIVGTLLGQVGSDATQSASTAARSAVAMRVPR